MVSIKNAIITLITLLCIFVCILLFHRIFCLKINKDYGFAIGQIIEIQGRDINEVEYAEYEFLVNGKVFNSETMITWSNIDAKQKFLVVFCIKNPKISVLLMNHSFEDDLPLETEIKNLYHKDSISIPWDIL